MSQFRLHHCVLAMAKAKHVLFRLDWTVQCDLSCALCFCALTVRDCLICLTALFPSIVNMCPLIELAQKYTFVPVSLCNLDLYHFDWHKFAYMSHDH